MREVIGVSKPLFPLGTSMSSNKPTLINSISQDLREICRIFPSESGHSEGGSLDRGMGLPLKATDRNVVCNYQDNTLEILQDNSSTRFSVYRKRKSQPKPHTQILMQDPATQRYFTNIKSRPETRDTFQSTPNTSLDCKPHANQINTILGGFPAYPRGVPRS